MATATPDPVTGISVSYTDTEANVSWYAPMNTGDAPIESYTVTAMPGSISTTVTSGTSATLSGLTNGTSYTFSVVATNQYGSSASVGVPGMPTSVTGISNNASVDLSWVAPSDDGGSAIVNYTITDNNGVTYTVSGTSTTITGLTNGTAYTFTVKATNANGSGIASATSNSVTPAPVVPGAPSAVIGTALNSTEIRLTWEAPVNTGGAAITGYSISVSPSARTITVGNVVETTITGLTAETQYTFAVRAINSAGTGASASSASVRATGSLYQWSKFIASSNSIFANSIASDSSGNVYVTGYTSGSGFTLSGVGAFSMNYINTTEAFAIKYNSSGEPVWATVISNSGTRDNEYPQKIYVDSNNNFYLTGYTSSSGFTVSGLGNLGKNDSTNDGFVLKYNASGVPQWGQIIKGTSDDYPYSVAADSMGSVYVVGQTNSSGFTISGLGNLKGRDGVDGFVVKYNNSGVPVWGSIIGASGSYYSDQVNAVTVDSSDNVYIGGYVQYLATFSGFNVTKSGGTYAAFVAKYNVSGAPQWVKLVDSTNGDDRTIDLKADSSGNVYLLGTTDTSGLTIGSIDMKKPDSTLDNFIVKYDPNGNALWARLIGGSSAESAVSIMIDSYNNVYALGQTTSSGFTVSGLNVPFVKTGNSTDMYVIKYNKDGNPVNATLLGGYGYQVPYYGTIANNQMTIAGYTTMSGLTVNSSVFNSMGEYDAYLIKLNNQGALDWYKILGGASVDVAYSISKNSSGRIFIGGSTRTSGLYSSSGTSMKQNYGYSLGIVIETSVSGIPIIATSLGEYSQWTTDEVRGIVHDADNNMFIVGHTNASGWRYKDTAVSFGSNYGQTSFILKQTPSGAVQWNAFVSGTSSEYSTGIAVSPSGSVAMTGYTDSPTVSVSGLSLNKGNYYEDGYIFKYTNTGQLQWGALIGGSVNHDRSLSVAIDSQENTYVVGYTETSGFTIPGYGSIGKTTNNRDGFVVKYNASGVATWAQLYAATTINTAYGVAVDQQNNVYVVGSTAASGFTISGLPSFSKNETSEDGFVVKYNSSGTPVWANIIQGVGNQQMRNVKVDASGNVYVTGLTSYPTTISGASNESSLKSGLEYSQDVFVAKYNSSGVYQWYKHVFGNGSEDTGGMLIESDGSVYIVGSTNAYDFDTVNFTSTQTPILTRLLLPSMSQTELVVSNSLTSTTSFSDYFASQSGETTVQLYLNMRKAMASLALGAAERAVAESRFVSAMRTYHGRSVLDITDASQFAGTLAGTTLLDTTKAIQVALPIYTNGTALFNISASSLRMDGSKQVLFEIPPNCTLTITDSQGNSSSYSNNGTSITDVNNGQYYKGSYIVIGDKVCSVLADGLLLMKPQFSQLVYNGTTAFTGASFESLYNAKTDASGNVYIVGYTGSSGFTISGAISKTTTTGDAFIAKLNSSGVGQWGSLHQPNVSIQYIAPDNNGNLYVGGRAYRTSWTVSGLGQIKTTLDYTWTPFMLKYNASGIAVWGNGNFANQLMYDQSVSCDNSGNSYLVGYTNANSFTISGMGFTKQDTSNDGVIVAFNPSGAVSWARLVSGTQFELSYSSAVDPQGSLIVASYISSSGFNMSGFPALSNQSNTADGLLMKFTASGTPVWNTYITDGSNDSWAQAITTDASGNVYVTGYVYTSGFSISGQPAYNKKDTSTDAFVAKYTPTGALDWFKLITTGTSDNSATEYGNAIVVDKENNIYVGGSTRTSGFTISGFPWFNKNNSSEDGFVVRYNPSGDMTYAVLLGNEGSQSVSNLAVSDSNLYIVGSTGTSGFQINKGTLTKSDWSRDGHITRYDSSGNFLGTTIVSSQDDDDVYDAVFDSANNYYVIGYSRKTGLVVPQLDLYNSYTMFYKLKYNSLGVPIAGIDLSLSPSFSSVDRLAIDGSGNTFITGFTYQSGLTLANLGRVKTNSGLDVYVIKQDPSGNNLWYRSFGGPQTSGWNFAEDLIVDANNDVYVAGYTYSNNFSVSGLSMSKYDTAYKAFIVKFDSAGSPQWGQLIEGSGYQYTYRAAAAYDGVYLAGYTNSAGIAPAGFPSLGKTDTNGDTILLKYSYSGTALWGRLIKNYSTKGVTTDASGNVSLTGWTRTSGFTISGLAATTKASTDVDTIVVKYSAAGAPVWSRLIGANNGDEEGYGIASDSLGNVYAATRTNAINYTMSGTIAAKADQTWDTLITKFNPSGEIIYGKIVGGSGDEVPRTIRVDANGNVALAGTTTTQGFDPSTYSPSPNDGYMIQYKLQGAYTPPAGALAAVTTSLTNASGVSDYFASQSERLFEDVYVEMRNALKASALAPNDDNIARNQFLKSSINIVSGYVFEISQANRSLFFNSMAMSATTVDKPIQVVMPAYDLSGSASFDIATAGLTFTPSKYIHFELPINNALTLINGATIKTFSYDGTSLVEGSNSYSINDTLTVGDKSFKLMALGSFTFENLVAPGAPTAVTASVTAASGQAVVSWTAPTSNGGADITSYTVSVIIGGSTVSTETSSTTSVTINGLTNGTSYTFTVSATNIAGTGTASSPSPAVIPYTVPDAPTLDSTSSGNATATLNWFAPAFNGGSTITGYTITASPYITPVTTSSTTATITQLLNGTTYTFSIIATNARGNSTALSTEVVLAAQAPLRPTGVSATVTAAAGQANVSWTAPSHNGGSAITSYTITSSSDSNNPSGISVVVSDLSGSDVVTSGTVTGLINGTSYTFTVSATNAVGTGSASTASAAVIPYTVPDAPTSVSSSSTNASATITWAAPAFNGGRAVTSYTITSDQGTTPVTTTALTYMFTGLTNSTAYVFSVVATNIRGDSSALNFAALTPLPIVPFAPQNVVAAVTANSGEVTVTWGAPLDDGGEAVTSYRVVASSGAELTASDPTQRTVTFTGLNNATQYTFTVYASNSVGEGAASSVSNGIYPGTLPTRPTITSTAASGANLTVNWTASSNQSGYSITATPAVKSYPLSGIASSANIEIALDDSTLGSVGSSVTTWTNAAGITNYDFTNTASGSWQAPTVVAGTVAGTKAVRFNGSNTGLVQKVARTTDISTYTVMLLAKPTSTGTNRILQDMAYNLLYGWWGGYTNEFYSDYNGVLYFQNVSGKPTAIVSDTEWRVFTFTLNGTALTMRVGGVKYSITGSGNSPMRQLALGGNAGAFNEGTACDVAAVYVWNNRVLSDMEAISYERQLVDKYGVPTSTWNSFDLDTDNGSGVPVTVSAARTATTATLNLGSSFGSAAISMKATNAIGDSETHVAVNSGSSTYFLPGAPTSVSATSGVSGRATVSWTAPASNGGSAITSYIVSATPSITPVTVTGATSSTISGLTNGTSYTFTVAAVNIVGTGPSSTPSPSATPIDTVPGAPTSVTADVSASASQAVVSWTAPTDNGGQSISNYTVNVITGGSTVSTVSAGTSTSATITGLTNGTSYTFTVTATNSIGTGSASTASSAAIPYTVPGAPSVVSITSTNGSATLSWSAPASNGGRTITDYTITANPSITAITTSSTSYTVTGLTNGTTYTFSVVANNLRGSSSAVVFSAVTPMPVAPSAPRSLAADVSVASAQANLSWLAPADNGGAAITQYTMTASRTGAADIVRTTSSTSYAFTGLTNGATYTFAVTATNSAGTSSAVTLSGGADNSTVPYGVPSAVQNLVSATTETSATLTWDPPASNGGRPVTSYSIATNPAIPNTEASPLFFLEFTNETSSSSTFADSTSNGNNFTRLNGTIETIGGRKGYRVPSRGTTTARIIKSFTNITSITYATWIRLESTPGSYNGIIFSRYNGQVCGIHLTGTNLRYFWRDWYYDNPSNVNLTVGTWQHIAVTITPTNAYFYLNGVLSDTKTISHAAVSLGEFYLGCDPYDNWNRQMAGYLDDCAAFPRALTQSEISALYTSGLSGYNAAQLGPITVSASNSNPEVFFLQLTNETSSSSTFVDSTSQGNNFTRLGGTIETIGGRKGYRTTGLGGNTARIIKSFTDITSITYLTWIRLEYTPGSYNGIIFSRYNGQVCGIHMTGTNLRYFWRDTYYDNPSNVNLTVGTWQHIAVTITPTNAYFYLNGVLSDTKTISHPSVSLGEFYLGCDPYDPWSRNVPAHLDDCAVYAKALTAQEIMAIYTSGYTPYSQSFSYTFNGLQQATTYTMTVTANNLRGASAGSVVYTTPAGAASAPRDLVVSLVGTGAEVSWRAPETNGGTPITSYKITTVPTTSTTTVTANERSAVITGLSTNTSYQIRVVAVNEKGDGAPATKDIVALATASPPSTVTTSLRNGFVRIEWSRPTDLGNMGGGILSYVVTATPTAGAALTRTVNVVRELDFTGLTVGETYTFTVATSTRAGIGSASTPTAPLLITVSDATTAVINKVNSPSSASIATFISNAVVPSKDVYLEVKQAIRDAVVTEVITTTQDKNAAKLEMIQSIRQKLVDAGAAQTNQNAVFTLPSTEVPNFIKAVDAKLDVVFDIPIAVVLPVFTAQSATVALDTLPAGDKYIQLEVPIGYTITLTNGEASKTLVNNGTSLTSGSEVYVLGDEIPVGNTYYNVSFFGTVGLHELPGGTSFGDPYVTTLSNVNYKLPAMNAPIRFYQGMVGGDLLTVNATLRTIDSMELLGENVTGFNALRSRIPRRAQNALSAALVSKSEELCFFERVYVKYRDSSLTMNLWNGRFQLEESHGKFNIRVRGVEGLLEKHNQYQRGYEGQALEISLGPAKLVLAVYPTSIIRNGICLYGASQILENGNGVMINVLGDKDMKLSSLDSLVAVPKVDRPLKSVIETFVDHDGYRKARVNVVRK
jgi:hypothetical protein